MTGGGAERSRHLEPKLLTVLREGYDARQFVRDLIAGIIVGIVALPLAIAFAIASGLKPEQGLYTAIVAGFLISAFGGSRVQIGGPTGAFIVIVYGIVQQHGYQGLAVATLMAGGLLIVMGLAGLGTVIEFVPYPVTVGFTSGIALIIAASQVRDFLGLRMDRVPADFLEKISAYAEHIGSWNPQALTIGLLTIVIIVYWPRLTHRVPGSLVAILLTTWLTHAFALPVDTIGDRFGAVPTTLPVPALPVFDWGLIKQMAAPAVTIAILAAIESLLSAVVADGMLGTRHRSNAELVAQGIANIVSPLFGGMPATGAIARTATNVKNGGRTPIAGLVHALTLLLIMLCFGRWAALIPLPSLAGILFIVAYHMSEWRHFARLFRSPPGDILILLNTFLLTVLIDLTVAIETGMILAAFLLMRRVAGLSQVGYVTDLLQEQEEGEDAEAVSRRRVPSGVEVFEVYGTFFFGAVSKFKDALRRVERAPKVLILRLREVHAIDATGLRVIEDLVDKNWRTGTALIVSGAQAQPMEALTRSGLVTRIGERNFQQTLDDALVRAREILDRLAAPGRESG